MDHPLLNAVLAGDAASVAALPDPGWEPRHVMRAFKEAILAEDFTVLDALSQRYGVDYNDGRPYALAQEQRPRVVAHYEQLAMALRAPDPAAVAVLARQPWPSRAMEPALRDALTQGQAALVATVIQQAVTPFPTYALTQLAVTGGHPEVVQALVDHQPIHPSHQVQFARTAIQLGHEAVAEALLVGADALELEVCEGMSRATLPQTLRAHGMDTLAHAMEQRPLPTFADRVLEQGEGVDASEFQMDAILAEGSELPDGPVRDAYRARVAILWEQLGQTAQAWGWERYSELESPEMALRFDRMALLLPDAAQAKLMDQTFSSYLPRTVQAVRARIRALEPRPSPRRPRPS